MRHKYSKRYVPKLPDFISLCERNYAQLCRLLPQPEQTGSSCLFNVSQQDQYCIEIIDKAPFTTTIRIELTRRQHRLFQPGFDVRIYHDARLAEVIACQHVRYFKAVYDYPNVDMLLPDEKRQINLLLRDWLALCVSQGYSADHQVVLS